MTEGKIRLTNLKKEGYNIKKEDKVMAYLDWLETVQKLYVAYYQRPADPGGLINWAKRIEEIGLERVLLDFVQSPESQALYGNKTIEEIIAEVYRSAFNRDPEPEGLNYWTKVYPEEEKIGTIVWHIVNGAQGDDKIIFTNKVKAADLFTRSIDPELDGKDFLVTYAGQEDAKKAREYLQKVAYVIPSLNDTKAYLVLSGIADISDHLLKAYPPQEVNPKSKSKVNLGYGPIADISSFNVKALDAGVKWTKKIITYSFPVSSPEASYPNWMPLDDFEKDLVRSALNKISAYVDLTFQEVPYGGDIQFGMADLSSYEASGITRIFSIGNVLTSAYVFFDRDLRLKRNEKFYSVDDAYTGWGVITIYHEIGHALGLKHPFEGAYILSKKLDSHPYTIMSYTPGRVYLPHFYYDGKKITGELRLYSTPSFFSPLDVEALQAKYGANVNTNPEDNVYNPETTSDSPFYLSLWDAGGVDTIDFSDIEQPCIVNLSDGTFSTIGAISLDEYVYHWTAKLASQGADPQFAESYVRKFLTDNFDRLYTGADNLAIVKGTIVENVKTGAGDDVVYDNVYDNVIETGDGDDVIYISGGYDEVYGGFGYDKVFVNATKSETSSYDGEWYQLLIGPNFAVKLVGIEEVVLSS